MPAAMPRRLFLAAAPAFVLSACGGLVGPPEAGTIYTLRPVFPPAPSTAAGEKVTWALSLLRPNIPGGLNSERIGILQPGGTQDYYAGATWPDRLQPLVQQAALDGFAASGRIDAVAVEQDALHADYNLLLDVRDFEARYAQADGIPEAVVTINAKLTTAHGRKIIASFTTTQTRPAGANSVGAATQALTLALGAAITAIVNWTLATAPPLVPGQSVETASPGKPAEQLLHETARGAGRLRPDGSR